MTDAAPQVRAEAARAAAILGDSALLPQVEKLIGDADANVRREAVLAATKLARDQKQSSSAIDAGLRDLQPRVIAAALQSAWTAAQAPSIAEKLPNLSPELQPEAAVALARLKATPHGSAVLSMLKGDVLERVAAVRALGDIGKLGDFAVVQSMLRDAHPSVRREAIIATGKLDPDITRKPTAVQLLADKDPTVREAAARVLTPIATPDALAAVAAQLDIDYAPLHDAARHALIRPANDSVRAATIAMAAEMLTHTNPRRREDASFVLGYLRSDAAIDRHVALLTWDPKATMQSDCLVIAQAAESLGMIGDARAASTRLCRLSRPRPTRCRACRDRSAIRWSARWRTRSSPPRGCTIARPCWKRSV